MVLAGARRPPDCRCRTSTGGSSATFPTSAGPSSASSLKPTGGASMTILVARRRQSAPGGAGGRRRDGAAHDVERDRDAPRAAVVHRVLASPGGRVMGCSGSGRGTRRSCALGGDDAGEHARAPRRGSTADSRRAPAGPRSVSTGWASWIWPTGHAAAGQAAYQAKKPRNMEIDGEVGEADHAVGARRVGGRRRARRAVTQERREAAAPSRSSGRRPVPRAARRPRRSPGRTGRPRRAGTGRRRRVPRRPGGGEGEHGQQAADAGDPEQRRRALAGAQ